MRIILLGPQRSPTVGSLVRSLPPDGPVATITAGWQEREPDDNELSALLGGAGEDHDLGAPEAVEHAGEEVVLEAVVERDLRRRAHDGDRTSGIQTELAEDGGVGFEVGEVVLLLEPGIFPRAP